MAQAVSRSVCRRYCPRTQSLRDAAATLWSPTPDSRRQRGYLQSMPQRAAEIMTSSPFSVPPSMLLSDLEWELSRRRFSGAPVVEDGKLVGVISRSDIVRRLGFSHAMSAMALDYYRQLDHSPADTAPGHLEQLGDQTLGSQLRTLRVRDAMTTRPAAVTPDQQVPEVARLMLERGVHRVFVMQGDNLLGVISTLDLVRLLAHTPAASKGG